MFSRSCSSFSKKLNRLASSLLTYRQNFQFLYLQVSKVQDLISKGSFLATLQLNLTCSASRLVSANFATSLLSLTPNIESIHYQHVTTFDQKYPHGTFRRFPVIRVSTMNEFVMITKLRNMLKLDLSNI